jgi:cytochrome c peroxidase
MSRFKLALSVTALAATLAFGFVQKAEAQRQIPPDGGSGGGDPGVPALTPRQLLGQSIFFDASLSTPDGLSCAGCHEPGTGWADARNVLDPFNGPTSEGVIRGRFGRRNSPAVTYGDFAPPFLFDALTGGYVGGRYWDGRAHNPLEQAKLPFLDHVEMNNHGPHNVVHAVRTSSYAMIFESVFGRDIWDNEEMAFDRIAESLAAFQTSHVLNRFDSRYDRLLAGDVLALTPKERAGLALFEGRGGCAGCHPGLARPDAGRPLFTTFRYYNLGVPKNPRNPFYDMPPPINPDGHDYIDLGLGGALGVASENGKFKVPSLRNVDLTPPYMHNGAFSTLYDAVMFHNTRDTDSRWGPPEVPWNIATGPATARGVPAPEGPTMPPDPGDPPAGGQGRIGNLMLSAGEVDQIVAYLKALSDGPPAAP